MLLYYHTEPGGNFGDDLNPFLWDRVVPGMFSGTVSHNRRRLHDPITEPIFVGIGTLLNEQIPAEAEKYIFGAGVGYGEGPPVVDETWHILCVRGPLSAKALGVEGLELTDPAALVSRLRIEPRGHQSKVSFMPHVASDRSGAWFRICTDLGVRYIDPRKPVNDVLRDIAGSDMLITEAMHGAIVADALRVPWVAVASANVLAFKWQDWCGSLGLEYHFHRIPRIWGADGGLRGKISCGAKMGLAARVLRGIMYRPQPVLSSKTVLATLCDQLEERLFDLQAELARRNRR